MMRRHSNKLVLGVILAVGIVAAVTVLAGHATAQLQNPPGEVQNLPPQPPAAVQIGTYDVQATFQQHPLQKELMESFTAIQTQLRQAGAREDASEEVQKLEQKYKKIREQIVELFQRDVRQALPTVAEETGVKAIALQVVYTDDDSEVVDVTPDLIKVLSKQNEEAYPTSPPATQQRLPNQ